MELSCHILKCIIELALGGDGGGAFYVMIPDSTGRIVKGIYGIVHIAFSQRRQRLPMVDRAEFIELLAKGIPISRHIDLSRNLNGVVKGLYAFLKDFLVNLFLVGRQCIKCQNDGDYDRDNPDRHIEPFVEIALCLLGVVSGSGLCCSTHGDILYLTQLDPLDLRQVQARLPKVEAKFI
jgi:hypothetical protein